MVKQPSEDGQTHSGLSVLADFYQKKKEEKLQRKKQHRDRLYRLSTEEQITSIKNELRRYYATDIHFDDRSILKYPVALKLKPNAKAHKDRPIGMNKIER